MKTDVSRLLERLALQMKEARTQRDAWIKTARGNFDAMERMPAIEDREDDRAIDSVIRAVRHHEQLVTLGLVLNSVQRQIAEEMQDHNA